MAVILIADENFVRLLRSVLLQPENVRHNILLHGQPMAGLGGFVVGKYDNYLVADCSYNLANNSLSGRDFVVAEDLLTRYFYDQGNLLGNVRVDHK